MHNNSTLTGFAQFLVQNNYVEEQKIQIAIQESIRKKIPLALTLGQISHFSYRKLAETIAEYFGLTFLDLDNYDLSSLSGNLLSTDIIQKYFVLPLFCKNNQLFLATSDPSFPNLSELNFLTGLSIILVIVEGDKLKNKIDNIFSNCVKNNLENVNTELQDRFIELSQLESEQAPVIKFIDTILIDAINRCASDIHFECYELFFRIRLRIDGMLHEVEQQPSKFMSSIVSRLKIMANLDISERRIPQDGRFKLTLFNNRTVDFRLNTCPTLFGEKAVLRILDSSKELLNLDILGMTEEQKKLFCSTINRSHGLILVTGPTGSGKTITLYTALDMLNTTAINIASIEDPIEIPLVGINQAQVNLKSGLSFAKALRGFLRQDPDVIMIGEIRDLETAEIAVKAAQTGHLVLSTLHTNSAPESLIRLSNIGIAPFNIASAITLIIAQRLIRRLCNNCKEKTAIPTETLLSEGFLPSELSELVIYKSGACDNCHQGYKGRIGIYEVMPISQTMAKLIMENATVIDLAQQARKENIPTLRRSGLEQIKNGVTSLEELNRIIKE